MRATITIFWAIIAYQAATIIQAIANWASG